MLKLATKLKINQNNILTEIKLKLYLKIITINWIQLRSFLANFAYFIFKIPVK